MLDERLFVFRRQIIKGGPGGSVTTPDNLTRQIWLLFDGLAIITDVP